MKLCYPIVLTEMDDGGYLVYVPDMDINTAGKDLPDAIYMARDAISLVVVTLQDEEKPIPPASDISAVKSEEEGAIITLVDADITAYKRMLEKRSVRKNVTIPSWLNEAAEAQHVNFSAVLQAALIEELHIEHR